MSVQSDSSSSGISSNGKTEWKVIIASLYDRGLLVGNQQQYVKESYRLWGLTDTPEERIKGLSVTEEMLDAIGIEKLKKITAELMFKQVASNARKPMYIRALLQWVEAQKKTVQTTGSPLSAAKTHIVNSPQKKPYLVAQTQTNQNQPNNNNNNNNNDYYVSVRNRIDLSVLTLGSVSEDSTQKIKKLEAKYAKAPSKYHYNYLLLDARMIEAVIEKDGSEKLPPYENFLASIFYVGKGAGNRLMNYYTASYELNEKGEGKDQEFDSPKLRRIRLLWQNGEAYYALKFSTGISEGLALDQENGMIRGMLASKYQLWNNRMNPLDGDATTLCNRNEGNPKHLDRFSTGQESEEAKHDLWDSNNELQYSRYIFGRAYAAFVNQRLWNLRLLPTKEAKESMALWNQLHDQNKPTLMPPYTLPVSAYQNNNNNYTSMPAEEEEVEEEEEDSSMAAQIAQLTAEMEAIKLHAKLEIEERESRILELTKRRVPITQNNTSNNNIKIVQ